MSPPKELCADKVSAVVLADGLITTKLELSLAVQIGAFAKGLEKVTVQRVTVPAPTTTLAAESFPVMTGDVPHVPTPVDPFETMPIFPLIADNEPQFGSPVD